jgi:CubicO group peptidase (beta-lactamase class C family)
MMLWEEGKFQLDDPVSRYIPEFRDTRVLESFNPEDTTYTSRPLTRPITIRHLLTHTSGLGYGMIDGDERFRMIYQKAGIVDLFTTRDILIGDNVRKLAALPLHHQPGEMYTYSEGLDVMGYLIEIWSGMPFDRFLRTRLFGPLGMEDTWFYLDDDLQDRLVTIQTLEEGNWVPYPVTFYDPDYPVKGARTFFSGGAGLCSTPEDYATFLQMYLNGGELNGVRILSRKTVETIMGNHFPEIWEDPESYYGLAFEVITSKGASMGGRGSMGTFGWGGYFNTQYFADPMEGLIGIIMKQTMNVSGDNTGQYFRQIVEQSVAD